MNVHRLADLTWEDVARLDLARTVAVLPVGATEAHGPHLPLDTDVVIATAMAEAGARRLAAHGIDTVILDCLQYAPAGFAAAFPGTIDIGEATFAALLADIAASVRRAGIGTLAIANAHFDPGNLRALRGVVSAMGAGASMKIVFPDVTRRPWGGRLTAEFKSGACHAGQYEGSIVLARAPERVREETMRKLKDNPASLPAAIAGGATDFADAGGPQAYFGQPAGATAEEGLATIEALGGILSEAVIERIRSGQDESPPEADRTATKDQRATQR